MIDKIHLKKHMNHREDLKNEQERYELLDSRSMLQSKKIDGLPHAANNTRDAGYISDTFEKMEVEKRIKKLSELIKAEYIVINQLIEKLPPDEKNIMKMRYYNCMEWSDIREIKYAKRRDYYENMEKYKDKVFKIHGSALKRIKEIQAAAEIEETVSIIDTGNDEKNGVNN